MAEDQRRKKLQQVAANDPDPARKAKAAQLLAEYYPETVAVESAAPPVDPADASGKGLFAQAGDYVSRGVSAAGKQLDKEVTMIASALGLAEPNPAGMELRRKAQAGADAINRGFSLGTYGPIMDALGLDTQERRDKSAAEFPKTAMGGQVIGGLGSAALMGPVGAVDQAVNQTVAAAAPRLAGTAAGRIGAGIASGAVQGGLTSTAEGKGLEGAAPGAVGGAVGSVLGEGARALASGIGKASPTVSNYRQNVKAGTYEQPEMQALPSGPLGVQKAAENAHTNIVGRDAAIVASEKAMYEEAIAPYMGRTIDRDAAMADVLARIQKNTDSRGEPQNATLDKAYRDVIEYLGGMRKGESGFTYDPPRTLKDVRGKLEGIRPEAAHGSTAPTPDNMVARKKYDTLKSAIDESAPEPVRAARSEAKDNADAARRRRDILWRTENSVTRGEDPATAVGPERAGDEITSMADDLKAGDMRVNKEIAGSRFIKRIGDDNEPGLAAKKYLDELSLDPEIARQLELVLAQKAKAGSEFSLKGLVPTDLKGTNEAGGWGPVIRQNSRALAGKVVAPGLGLAAEQLPQLMTQLGIVDPAEAVAARRKKQQQTAQKREGR